MADLVGWPRTPRPYNVRMISCAQRVGARVNFRKNGRRTTISVPAKRSGLQFRFVAHKGKGSHGKLVVGDNATTVKRTELGKALLHAMLKNLDIDKEAS